VLAVRSEPERVYRRALRFFTPEELAEAFAATRGVASPTQLRAFMKRYPRDVLAVFRSLAPPRKPIALQRWSVRRVATALGMVVAALTAVSVGAPAFQPLHNPAARPPQCGTGDSMLLAAQAVPTATMLPCVAELPSGWRVDEAEIATGRVRFRLASDQAGIRAVTVSLTGSCDVSGAQEIPSDEPGMRRFDSPTALEPAFLGQRLYTFPGGCVTYDFRFAPGVSPRLAIPIDSAVEAVPRSLLVEHVRSTEDLELCGSGASCPT
jgi:hypothetical protein